MKLHIKYLDILYLTLLLYVSMIFFRDAILFSEYLLIHKTIPSFRIELDNISLIAYIRDISILIWNFVWTIFLFKKNKIVISTLFLFVCLIDIGLVLAGSNVQPLLVVADLRILNGIYSVIGILLIVKYFVKRHQQFQLFKIIKYLLFLSFIDAIITIIEFNIIHGLFGFRVMGIFSNAALNSYVLMMSVVLAYLLNFYKYITNYMFYFLSLLFSFAILTTGTRTSIVGVLIVLALIFFIRLFFILEFSFSKSMNLKISYIIAVFLMLILLSQKVIYTANVVADRGNMLNQSENGRLSNMIDIINSLSSDGVVYLLFGKGSGFGSNIASSSPTLPEVYKSVDGTIQFLFVHSGIFGIFVFLMIIFQSYIYIKDIKMFMLIVIPMLIVSMSTTIFEIYPLLLMYGLALSFVNQQDYYESKKL